MNTPRRSVRSVAALGAALALALAGCGGSDAADTTDATAPAAAATTTGAEPVDTVPAVPAVTDGPDATDVGTGPAAAGDNAITIADFAFSGVTEVPIGTTVVVTNTDSSPHTFTSDDGLFDSGSLRQDDTFEFTFDTAGEFAYHCNFHSSMTGSITVTG